MVALVGCRENSTSALTPDYRASPAAVSFSACPTKDVEHGNAAVADVYPDTQKVTISNSAKVGAGLKLSISGQDAAAFRLVDPVPTSVGPGDSAQVSIAFSPDRSSAFKAILTIDDDYAGTADVMVDLSGEGKNLPAQPTLVAAPLNAEGRFENCGPFDYCPMNFTETLFDKTVTQQLKIRNTGCPALKITGLEITAPRVGGTQGFSIIEPVNLPSAAVPMVLSPADGIDEVTVTVAFTPIDDGSGDTDRNAVLTITSNDPINGSTLIPLAGNGLKPSAYASPTSCDFSNASDRCGNPSKVNGQASFRIANDGNAPIKITTTTFKSTGSQTSGVGGRFQISTALAGTTIGAGSSATLAVTYTDAPLYVTEQLEVNAVFAADSTTAAGSLTLGLFGGSKPCLTTTPVNTLNFNAPSADETTQPVTLSNGAGCGTLTLGHVSIDTSAFFRLGEPAVAPNTQVAPGSSVQVNVTYKRPASGGMQLGTLRIVSNDSDYGAAKFVQLVSSSPLDEVPVAELRGCTQAQLAGDPHCAMGATSSMTASLASLGNTRVLTLSGTTSYDPVPNSPGGKRAVSQYRFTLLPPLPSNVTAMSLASNDLQLPAQKTTLSLGAQPALYRIGLTVYDDRGQQSTAATLNINITP